MPTNIINVTPVEATDPTTGEVYWYCSRPVIDAPSLWTIFTTHLHGHMELAQALTALDGQRFDRKGSLSKADINRARNVFRAIEKYGRLHGAPCIPIHGREHWYDLAATYFNKYMATKNQPGATEYWVKRARVAEKEAEKLPRGKTAIRLADLNSDNDKAILLGDATRSDQISETYAERVDQLAEPIGMLRYQVHLKRKQAAANQEAEAAHEQTMATASKGE